MIATSALSATGTPSIANPSLRDLVASLCTVVVPASPATYANRAALRAIGLRWDPVGHHWHGTTTSDRVRELRERLGLEVQCFGTLEPFRGPSPPRPPAPDHTSTAVPPVVRDRDATKRLRDGLQTNPSGSSHPRSFVPGTRTRAEARVVYRDGDDDVNGGFGSRRFTLLEITSGLPDDSRESNERTEERRLRDLRSCVKKARAVAASTPGLDEILANDWQKAARFYARYGVTEATYRHGVRADAACDSSGPGLYDLRSSYHLDEFRLKSSLDA
jgi:hypothetical protein